jgi:hypothetical protein
MPEAIATGMPRAKRTWNVRKRAETGTEVHTGREEGFALLRPVAID